MPPRVPPAPALASLVLLLAPLPATADDAPREVPRAASAIRVDGRIDEPAWERALALELPVETSPGDNVPAPVRTELYLTYDDDHLYAAIRAHDPDPKAVRAHLRDRDSAFSDDFAGIVIDTFNDRRRAFEFFVNPLGVQMDLVQDDVNGSEDSSWDAIWSSAGALTDTGWSVELAVPFASLRFPKSDGALTWGLDAVRIYPRDQRRRIGLNRLDRDVDCYLCQHLRIRGFEGVRPGRDFEVVPTLTARRTAERADFPRGPFEGDTEADPGVSASWAITSGLTLGATANPDFSQVEADVAQLAVNERFALFFPEKRPFFLEAADYFETPLSAVFTRTIADPDWGLKLTGKREREAFGLLVARDAINNLLLPGAQLSDQATLEDETTTTVLRYRRDLARTSTLGLLVTDREGTGYHNRLAGVDALLRPTPKDTLRVQYLHAFTRYPDAFAAEHAQPRGGFDGGGFRARYNRSTRDWFAYAEVVDLDRGLRVDAGFLPQVDKLFLLGGLERSFWSDGKRWWPRMTVGGDWDLTQDQSGRVLEREVEFWYFVQGPWQAQASVDVGWRERFFGGRTFDEAFQNLSLSARPSGWLSLGVDGRFGDDIDFANVQPARRLELAPYADLFLGKSLSLSPRHTLRRLSVDGERLFTANLFQLRAVYQFNVRTFVRAIVQLTAVDRDPARFVEAVDARTRQAFNQLLFSYKLNPQTVLFLGYSDNHTGDDEVDLAQRDRTFFLKLGYAWRL